MNKPVPVSPSGAPLEIERKFLIAFPDQDWLRSRPGSRRVEIVQTYLLSENGKTRRVRSWTEDGKTVYIRTVKRSLTDRTREETEDELTSEEYDALLSEADPNRRPLQKTRWCVPFEGHTLEIDLYPFWTEQAILEVELGSEEEEFRIPPEIRVLREVTGDPRYLNSSLARELP
ncbi:MAG: hypothetical protein IJV41_05590 [Oscillospiraceae bacterium]|nr:hypothetical protein [Oscillospiraceae bacterium]MBQ9686010.1 hypothetical protein [Oscillospiraceae bacterium]